MISNDLQSQIFEKKKKKNGGPTLEPTSPNLTKISDHFIQS